MGVGIVIRDEKGNVVAATGQPDNGNSRTSNSRSILAALKAVEFCSWEVGAYDISLELEGDSLLVVKAISESRTSWLRYGQNH